jgi:hypothetical protein
MRKPAALATAAMSLALVAPVSAATANPDASCAGQVGANLAGESGARAVVAHGFIAEASEGVHPPGAFQSEWSRLHEPLEGCLEFITP